MEEKFDKFLSMMECFLMNQSTTERSMERSISQKLIKIWDILESISRKSDEISQKLDELIKIETENISTVKVVAQYGQHLEISCIKCYSKNHIRVGMGTNKCFRCAYELM